jgi:hypothetical protein
MRERNILPPTAAAIDDPAMTPQLRTSDVESLSRTFVDSYSTERIALQLKYPVLRWQKERVATIAGENIPELVNHLADYDDFVMAASDNDALCIPSDAESQMFLVVHLARVRRLLELSEFHSQEIKLELRHAFMEALNKWPEAFEANQKELNGVSSRIRSKQPGLNEFEKAHMTALTATYLLAFLRDVDSLPLFFRSYELGQGSRYAPVPPALTLYGIHKLIKASPDKPSSSAGILRTAFLDAASQELPPSTFIEASAWNELYQESDPRLQKVDRRRLLLQGQRHIEVEVYPTRFRDGAVISNSEGFMTARGDQLLRKASAAAKALAN